MKESFKNFTSLLATKGVMSLFSNPYVLAGLGIGLVIFLFIFMFMSMEADVDRGIQESAMEDMYVSCEPPNEDGFSQEWQTEYASNFDDRGAFNGAGELFLDIANQYDLDPVLFASIAFHETDYGTSNLVENNNNPGGLYNSSEGDFYEFNSLRMGLDRMANNLHENYIQEGLVSIEQIGDKYAPIGVDNDPNNLNANWIPRIKEIANNMGGLVLNCEEANFGNGEFAYPVSDGYITSEYGYRIDPITGATGDMHKGIDFDCEEGEPIHSALEGEVVDVVSWCPVGDSSCGGGYGNRVLLKHNGEFTLYAHMTNAHVMNGDKVETSEQIGTCGTTGSSTGTHLHFEVQLSQWSEHTDPAPYFESEEGTDET